MDFLHNTVEASYLGMCLCCWCDLDCFVILFSFLSLTHQFGHLFIWLERIGSHLQWSHSSLAMPAWAHFSLNFSLVFGRLERTHLTSFSCSQPLNLISSPRLQPCLSGNFLDWSMVKSWSISIPEMVQIKPYIWYYFKISQKQQQDFFS